MNRRGFLTGVASLLAAPAIVRAGSLMPVSVVPSAVNPMVYLGYADLKIEGGATMFGFAKDGALLWRDAAKTLVLSGSR